MKEELPKAKVRSYQVHVSRNVLTKMSGKLKKAVADDMRPFSKLVKIESGGVVCKL
jgi:transposase-like protein